MKFIRITYPTIILLSALVAMQACKAKKVIQKPVKDTVTQVAAVQQPAPQKPVMETKPVEDAKPAPQTPDYNFSNIQFEFNSSALKTDSYPLLDKAAANIKMDPSVKFIIGGYASEEGTPEHNMELSVDRANAVKLYLVNAGIPGTNLTAKGFGTANPIADNSNEDGRMQNRRVEIKKQN